nr:MAG TPA: hypothetical protein [Caudoviricetes sp.]
MIIIPHFSSFLSHFLYILYSFFRKISNLFFQRNGGR